MEPEDAVEMMNPSELVQALSDVGIRAHRGLPKKLLAKVALTGKIPKGHEADFVNPFDELRRKIMVCLTNRSQRLRLQLGSKCTTNCFDHTDMQVLACYIHSKKTIEEESKWLRRSQEKREKKS